MRPACDGIRGELTSLARQIAAEPGSADRMWGGAGIAIRTSAPPRPPKPDDFFPDRRFVVTQHASQLSWLLFRLWDLFRPSLDHVTKFEFLGRLANAALRYQDLAGDVEDPKGLLFAVLHESYAIADDIEQGGTFEGPTVTYGNRVFDDLADDTQRRGFVDIESTRTFFEDLGIR